MYNLDKLPGQVCCNPQLVYDLEHHTVDKLNVALQLYSKIHKLRLEGEKSCCCCSMSNSPVRVTAGSEQGS